MYYVYIMTNRRNGTLYTGVTNELWRRTREHKEELNEGFTQKYQLKRLVYYEAFGDINKAISREKKLKNWQRKWKLDLIESVNPQWLDLYEVIYQHGNVMAIDPQSKAGRTLVMLKPSKDSEDKHVTDRLDPGSEAGMTGFGGSGDDR